MLLLLCIPKQLEGMRGGGRRGVGGRQMRVSLYKILHVDVSSVIYYLDPQQRSDLALLRTLTAWCFRLVIRVVGGTSLSCNSPKEGGCRWTGPEFCSTASFLSLHPHCLRGGSYHTGDIRALFFGARRYRRRISPITGCARVTHTSVTALKPDPTHDPHTMLPFLSISPMDSSSHRQQFSP